MNDFRDNLKLIMAPYRPGGIPNYQKTTGEVKKLENEQGNNEVKASALRDIVRDKTNGKIEVTDSINNENALLGILRAYLRMKDYGGEALSPNDTIVFDPYPDWHTLVGAGGTYYDRYGYNYMGDSIDDKTRNKDVVMLRNTSFDKGIKPVTDTRDNRFHPTSTSTTEDIATHEFAHAAKEGYDLAEIRMAHEFANGYRDARRLENALEKLENPNEIRYKIYEKAAKNTGFNSVEEANASISEYAQENDHEAFAEAYSDVLLNKEQARPYSKELVRLYLEEATRLFNKYMNSGHVQARRLKNFFDTSLTNGGFSLKRERK